MIIIKSLKDSVVFKEAQVEAERKARELADKSDEEEEEDQEDIDVKEEEVEEEEETNELPVEEVPIKEEIEEQCNGQSERNVMIDSQNFLAKISKEISDAKKNVAAICSTKAKEGKGQKKIVLWSFIS